VYRSSNTINLQAGGKYYLELVGREGGVDDYFRVAVTLPDGTNVTPISYDYLEPYN